MVRLSSRFATELCTISALLKINKPKQDICIQGWVSNAQKYGKFYFLKINDGLGVDVVQAVIPRNLCEKINIGSAVKLRGEWVESKGPKQPMELIANECNLVGYNEVPLIVDDNDLLRTQPHLRPKNKAFAAILRLRSRLNFLSHKFFMDRNFHHIDTPLISQNDCEGAGEAFTLLSSKDSDYFGDIPVFLPVSSQLHLEVISGAIPNVYTIGAALRADKNQTRQHLAEFRMLEAECAFMDSVGDLCDLVEDYTEAMEILEKKGQTDAKKLNKQNELALVEEFNGPVFVLNFPVETNPPFYMKRNENGKFAENFDLLSPFVGELAGGSVRENNPGELMKRHNADELAWYFELRKSGYPMSSGFGLGMERFMQSLLGIASIKDTLAFPRWFKHCKC